MTEPQSFLSGLERATNSLAIALIALGVIGIVAPAFAGAPVVIIVGLVLAAAGGVRTAFGWRAWSAGKGPVGVAVGLLAAACGLALVFNPVSTLGAVSSLVAAYLVFDGVAELFFSGRLRDEEGRQWMWAGALWSIVLGVSMWIGWPLAGLRALGVLIGLKLIAAGTVLRKVGRGLDRAQAGIAAVRARINP